MPRSHSFPAQQTETPLYILESSLTTQKLWHKTAGKRPKQPESERRYFENLWRSNFENSCIDSLKVFASPDKVSEKLEEKIEEKPYRKRRPSMDGEEEIVFKGKGAFSNSVSRAFIDHHFSTITLQLPRFKISKLFTGEIHASFLIVVAIGGVSFGVWKRHSDFKALAEKLQKISGSESEQFRNSILSWQCVMQRKQWFRSAMLIYLFIYSFYSNMSSYSHSSIIGVSTRTI